MPDTGTTYVIYNLQNEGEFDVSSDPRDVRAMASAVGSEQRDRRDQREPFTLPRAGQCATQKVIPSPAQNTLP
eukprot:2100106-Pyramimonas_sp.AAC.2